MMVNVQNSLGRAISLHTIQYKMTDFVIQFFLQVRESLLPLTTLVSTIAALFVAYQKGLFSKLSVDAVEQSPSIQMSDVTGNVQLAPTNAQRIAFEASKVDEYHQQSISQARISFWFSLGFASLGFLIISTSVFTYSDKTGYLGIVAGTVIDAVAALFFYQSNQARKSMAEFFDRLRDDHKIEESLRLCEQIDDPSMRNALRTKLSLHFADIDGSSELLSQILQHSASSSKTRGNNMNLRDQNEFIFTGIEPNSPSEPNEQTGDSEGETQATPQPEEGNDWTETPG